MFRLLCSLFGLLTLGIWGAAIGYFIGSIFDRTRRLGLGAINPMSAAQRQHSFLQTTFTLMGRLAKSDGHVSQAEIDTVEQFMKQLGMTSEHRKQAISFFKQGADASCDVDAVLNDFAKHCGQTKSLNQALISYLMVVALADGVIHQAEQQLLEHIAQKLGFSREAFEQLLQMIMAQNSFADGAQSQANIDDAYKALGVSESASDKELKRAYRKLMSQYHPDKLTGQGLPEDMIKEATERAQEISKAYELIKKQRSS